MGAATCCGDGFCSAGTGKLVGADGKLDGVKYGTIQEEGCKRRRLRQTDIPTGK